jgi:hypothetical protein
MQPWERRLRDTAIYLRDAGQAYFSPDDFRRNVNNFLQTARTVTLVLVANKRNIPGFEEWHEGWYRQNVDEAVDPIMSWAVKARNQIEKKGDLELNSTLAATVIFSRNPKQDIELKLDVNDLLTAGPQQILERALEAITPDLARSSILRLQRRWVTSSLDDAELGYAMRYVYARLYKICESLAKHLGEHVDSTVPHPVALDAILNDVGRIRYFKFGNDKWTQSRVADVTSNDAYEDPAGIALRERIHERTRSIPAPRSFAQFVESRCLAVEASFEVTGFQIDIMELVDREWNSVYRGSFKLRDKSETFIFPRESAERASYLKAHAFVEISFGRMTEMTPGEPGSRRLIGMVVLLVAGDATGSKAAFHWEVKADSSGKLLMGSRTTVDSANLKKLVNDLKAIVDAP